MTLKLKAVAAACSLAFAVTVQAQQQGQQQGQQQATKLAAWDITTLYRNGWSADQMLDTEVRGPTGENIGEVEDIIVGPSGKIDRVVVEVGGFLGIGDKHIGVPWKEVRIGPDMQYVQVPVTEENRAGYPLYDDRSPEPGNWRVEELIGDLASLEDVPQYGRVSDIIFDGEGQAHGVIVDRIAGRSGPYGRYAYPYTGYYAGRSAYPLPYRSTALINQPRFEYVQLGELSRFARSGEAAAGGRRPQGDAGQK